MSLFGIGELVREHHRSLIGETHAAARVYSMLYGPGLLIAGVIAALNLRRSSWIEMDTAVGASIGGSLAFIASVMFGVGVAVLDKAIDLDMDSPRPGPDTELIAVRLQALSANTLFTSLVAGLGSTLVLVGQVAPGLNKLSSLVGVSVLVTVGTTAILVVGRVNRETRWRTDRARTGESTNRK